jgi:hypothetical protein
MLGDEWQLTLIKKEPFVYELSVQGLITIADIKGRGLFYHRAQCWGER